MQNGHSSSQGRSTEHWHSSSQSVFKYFGKPAAPPPAAGFFVFSLSSVDHFTPPDKCPMALQVQVTQRLRSDLSHETLDQFSERFRLLD